MLSEVECACVKHISAEIFPSSQHRLTQELEDQHRLLQDAHKKLEEQAKVVFRVRNEVNTPRAPQARFLELRVLNAV